MSKIIRIFKCLIINNIKLCFIKIFHFRRFKFNFLNLIVPSVTLDIQNNGKIMLGKMCRIKKNCSLEVRNEGIIEIGKNVFINCNTQITSHKKITICENTFIGPNVVIVDHDHSFSSSSIAPKKFKADDVFIGRNVWIGANCVILKGTKIGDNSIVGAGTILKGEIPNGSIVVQKRENTISIIKE